jgi:FkbM family methyltransferase
MLKKIAARLFRKTVTRDNYARTSYAQCGEDLIIEHIFNQLNIPQPSYIDIGAHHPRYLNNTYLFYLKGSRGINIEPDPDLIAKFTAMRPEDHNLNVGVGEADGEADFYLMTEPTLNTFIKEEAENARKVSEHYKVREVKKLKVRTVAGILKEFAGGRFPDLLSIDVEGLDEQILRSFNYNEQSPVVLCVETISFSPQGAAEKKTGLIEFLKAQGYFVYADTYINTIFVKTEKWK